MASFDKLDWHLDAAIAAGQPEENAFTHIGIYLAWLIRNDLHDPEMFPSSHIAGLKTGAMTGSDLADDIDTKLVSPVMTAEGAAFSAARYDAYLAEYAAAFPDEPDYSISDDAASYARVAPRLDRLYAQWVADGRPGPAPEAPEAPGTAHDGLPDRYTFMPGGISSDIQPGMSHEFVQSVLAEMASERPQAGPSQSEQDPMIHAAPELEALLPRDMTSPPMDVSSARASQWGSSLLNRALKRLEIGPKDAVVVVGMGGLRQDVLAVTLYGVPGIPADRLLAEFEPVIPTESRTKWEQRGIAGRTVRWSTGKEFAVAYWAREGLVTSAAGRPDVVLRAIPLLP